MQITENARFSGNVAIAGTLSPPRVRTELATDVLQVYGIPWSDLRVWDAVQTVITTAAADDLGLTAGAFATGVWYVTAGDNKALGATSRYCRFTFVLPPEYIAGGAVKIQFSAGMLTTVAGTSCVVDAQAYKSNRDTLITGVDLVTTSAQSMNSLTFADLAFVLTSTGLSPGNELDVRVTITCTDAATGTAVTPALGAIEMLCDIKG